MGNAADFLLTRSEKLAKTRRNSQEMSDIPIYIPGVTPFPYRNIDVMPPEGTVIAKSQLKFLSQRVNSLREGEKNYRLATCTDFSHDLNDVIPPSGSTDTPQHIAHFRARLQQLVGI